MARVKFECAQLRVPYFSRSEVRAPKFRPEPSDGRRNASERQLYVYRIFMHFCDEKSPRGGFCAGPGIFLALPKKRAKNRDFRVFFRVFFRQIRKGQCRRAGGEPFCRPAAPDLGNTQSKKDTDENGMQKCVICARSATVFFLYTGRFFSVWTLLVISKSTITS